MKNAIKVVVVGNCQARPIAKILESLNQAIEVTAVAIVHLLKSEQFSEYKRHFEEADIIISQLVFDTYHCDFVKTNFLKSTYGNKVVAIVNLYFSGYTPDWFYIRIPGVGPLRGPMGDYHNRTVIECWQQGKDEQTVASLLGNKAFNERYVPEIESSLSNLKEREKLVDVPITDFIEKNFRKGRLFFTFNHPTMMLMREYCVRILKMKSVKIKRKWFSFTYEKESLNQFVPLVNPAVGLPSGGNLKKHLGVSFSVARESLVTIGAAKKYSNLEIVQSYYQIYDQLDDQLSLKKYGLAQK